MQNTPHTYIFWVQSQFNNYNNIHIVFWELQMSYFGFTFLILYAHVGNKYITTSFHYRGGLGLYNQFSYATVPSQESERSYICMLWVSILPLSTIFRLDFGNMAYFLVFHIITTLFVIEFIINPILVNFCQ
jgi:hypothetical protein